MKKKLYCVKKEHTSLFSYYDVCCFFCIYLIEFFFCFLVFFFSLEMNCNFFAPVIIYRETDALTVISVCSSS